MSKDNCLGIWPFLASQEDCQNLCQKTGSCVFYRYVAGEVTLQDMGRWRDQWERKLGMSERRSRHS